MLLHYRLFRFNPYFYRMFLRSGLPLAALALLLLFACNTEKKVPLHLSIHLDDTYDSSRIANDLLFLQNVTGVKSVTYISKEKAQEIYLQDGGESWEGILDENPLPASFEIDISEKGPSEKDKTQWEENIRNNIHGVGSFTWSSPDKVSKQ